MTFSHRYLVILMLGAAACGGRAPVAVAPAPATPEATVQQFLMAANAADLGRMAELWGNERGPSAVSSPNSPEVRQRQLTIMQRVLQSDQHRIVGSASIPDPARRVLNVELVRGTRRVTVPFTLVVARTGGWLISEIGLDAAIPPASPGPPN